MCACEELAIQLKVEKMRCYKSTSGLVRRPKELLLKEALHIQVTPADEHFNRDRGLELPDYWMVTLTRLEGGVNSGQPRFSTCFSTYFSTAAKKVARRGLGTRLCEEWVTMVLYHSPLQQIF